MPFCQHCTAETDQRCACCPATHYCSKECQREDWYSVHKFERHFYQLGKSDSSSRGREEEATTASVEVAREQKKMSEATSLQRAEYDRVVARLKKFLAVDRPRTRREMRMTHKDRKELEIKMSGIFEDPKVVRERRRRHFRQTIEEIVSTVRSVPSTSEDGPSRELVFDAQVEAQIAVLMRNHDLLHQMEIYAFATADATANKDAADYRLYTEEQDRLFIHTLLLGDEPDVTYAETQENRQQAAQSRLVEEYINHLLEKAQRATVSVGVRYLYAKDHQAEAARKSGLYGGKEGEEGGNDDDTKKTDDNVIRQVEASQAGVGRRMIENFRRMLRGLSPGGDSDAEQTADYEEMQATKSVLSRIGERVWDKVTDLTEATEKGKEWATGIGRLISEEYGINRELPDRLANLSLSWGVILCLIVFVYLSAMFTGYYFGSNPLTPDVESLAESIDQVQSNAGYAVATVGGIAVSTQVAINATRQWTQRIGKVSDTETFLMMPLNDKAFMLDDFGPKTVIYTTVTKLTEQLNKSIKDPDAPSWEKIKGVIREALADVMACEKYDTVQCSARVLNLQRTLLHEADFFVKAGVSIYVKEAREMLSQFDEFARLMDANVPSLNEDIQSILAEGQEMAKNSEELKERLRENAMAAPLFASVLKSATYIPKIANTMAEPILDVSMRTLGYAASGAFLSMRAASGFDAFVKATRLMRNLVIASGMLETQSPQSWLGCLLWMLSSGQPALQILAHTGLALSLLRLPRKWQAGMVDTLGWLTGKLINGLVGGGVDQAVVDKMQPVADVLTNRRVNKTPEGAVKAAFKRLNQMDPNDKTKKLMTPYEYGVLIQLILKKKVTYGDVLVNQMRVSRPALFVDAAAAVLNLVAFVFMIYTIGDFYLRLIEVIYWLFSLLTWGFEYGTFIGLSYMFVAYSVVVYLFAGFDWVISSIFPRTRQPGEEPIPQLVAPMHAFYQFVTSPPTMPRMFFLSCLHLVLSAFPSFGRVEIRVDFLERLFSWLKTDRELEAKVSEVMKLYDPFDTKFTALVSRSDSFKDHVLQLSEFMCLQKEGNIKPADIEKMGVLTKQVLEMFRTGK